MPADQVTKLRMALAQDNLPAAGVGYEIFDKSDAFGTTAFVQNINRLRALEGELARSIQTIDGIESARVHLVIPERQIFSRDDQTPSASVVLKTPRRAGPRPGAGDPASGRGRGRRAHRPTASPSSTTAAICWPAATTRPAPTRSPANQDADTTDYEDRLRQRIESIVASVVGAGHVRVQVAADMNYNHTTDHVGELRSRQQGGALDPDGRAERHRHHRRQPGGGVGRQRAARRPAPTPAAATTANPLRAAPRKPPITKSPRTSPPRTEDGGDVKRLSVAVVVDGTRPDDGPAAYKPRTPHEMAQITTLVKSAMGFDAARGDQVQVTNMEFARIDAGDGTPAPKPLLGLDAAYWFKIIEAAIMCVTALLIGLFVARPLISRMFAPNAAGAAQPRPSPAPRRSQARCRRPAAQAGATPTARPASTPCRAPAAQHRHQPHRRPGARILHQESRRSGARRILKKRWRSSAPGCINRYNPWRSAQKPASKKISGRSPGAERAAILMLSLGEEHSAKIWADDGRGRDQGSLPGDVQSGLGLLQR